MKILLATTNPHKLHEIGQMVRDPAIELLDLAKRGLNLPEPEEDRQTFQENAVLKATYYAVAAQMLCLADDSGLEVDALGGEPGVRSARYSGIDGPRNEVDPANNRKLLSQLSDLPLEQRTARFVCAMALVSPPIDGAAPAEYAPFVIAPAGDCYLLALVRGTIEGRILVTTECSDPCHPEHGRGDNGFGYDPLFFVPELSRTTAELSPEKKNEISHRGGAARKMMQRIRLLLIASQQEPRR